MFILRSCTFAQTAHELKLCCMHGCRPWEIIQLELTYNLALSQEELDCSCTSQICSSAIYLLTEHSSLQWRADCTMVK